MIQKKHQEQYDYILSQISSEDDTLTTPEEKLQFFVNRFHREYDNQERRKMWPNLQERISEYLKGLPSCIHIAYGTWHIGNIGEEWGIVKSDRQKDRFVNNWWQHIAFRILQLCEHYKIEFPKEAYRHEN